MNRMLTALLTLCFVGQSLSMAVRPVCFPPCQFEAECLVNNECGCPDFAYGDRCEYEILEEAPPKFTETGKPILGCIAGKYPCQKTQCDQAPGEWGLCDCPEGWGGMFCEVNTVKRLPGYSAPVPPKLPARPPPHVLPVGAVESCRELTCHLNGKCINTRTGVKCLCDPGWTGARCATEMCSRNSCNGNGVCMVSIGEAVNCGCDEGWTSARCNTQMCLPLSCSGHGTCQQHYGKTTTCICDAGWKGARCHIAVGSPPPPPPTHPSPSPVPAPAPVPKPVPSPAPTPSPVPVPVPVPVPSPSPIPVPKPPVQHLPCQECNNKGVCDLSTGELTCTCFDGWVGEDCTEKDCSSITCPPGTICEEGECIEP